MSSTVVDATAPLVAGSAARAQGAWGRARIEVAAGSIFLLVLILWGAFGYLPYSPVRTDPAAVLLAPSGAHWLGTDNVGADVLSRVIRAAATDLPLALAGTAAALVVGVPLGLLLSSSRNWGERGMRVLDGFQALPLLVLVLALVALSGNNILMVPVAVAIYGAPVYIRLVRSQVLTLRESRFVEAARAAGAGPGRIIRRHLLPNIVEVVLAQTSLVAAGALLAIAALSFLGIGVEPPTVSWGSMIAGGQDALVQGNWWPVVAPGAAIFVCVMVLNLVADGLRKLAEGSAK